MKACWGWVAGLLLLGTPALHAQTPPGAATVVPPLGSALPPPGINDPGATPVAPQSSQSIPLPSTGIPPSLAPAARAKDGNGDSTNVSVRTNSSGDSIQEYRRNGHVYMVRVTPKHGVTQTYMVNDNTNGSLGHDPKTGPVAPVYYDLYQWGKPHPPASAASSGG